MNNQIKWPSELRLKRRGLTLQRWHSIRVKQHDKCAICRQPFRRTPCMDHDHKTGSIRGLLCNKCNFILGQCNDNIMIFKNAIKYLKRYNVEQSEQMKIDDGQVCINCNKVHESLAKIINIQFNCRTEQSYALTIKTDQQFCVRCLSIVLRKQITIFCKNFTTNNHIVQTCARCKNNTRQLLPKVVNIQFNIKNQQTNILIKTDQQFCERCWPRITRKQILLFYKQSTACK